MESIGVWCIRIQYVYSVNLKSWHAYPTRYIEMRKFIVFNRKFRICRLKFAVFFLCYTKLAIFPQHCIKFCLACTVIFLILDSWCFHVFRLAPLLILCFHWRSAVLYPVELHLKLVTSILLSHFRWRNFFKYHYRFYVFSIRYFVWISLGGRWGLSHNLKLFYLSILDSFDVCLLADARDVNYFYY